MFVRQILATFRWALVVALAGGLGGLALPARAEDLQSSPATTVAEWMAQIGDSQVQITDVRVEQTEAGLQVVLSTADGELLTPVTSVMGNALIVEIPNAVLVGDEVEQFEPAEGIALVQVSALPEDWVQVVVTGTDAPPTAETDSAVPGLTLSVVPGIAQVGATAAARRILVTGEEDEGYNPSSASTATRTDTPLRDIPQSIQVVPQQVIEDRGVDTVMESVGTVSGVGYDGGFAGAPTGSVIIRGFSQSQQFRNGFRDTDRTGLTAIGTVEQVEILKGPASVLFGAVEPGGIVNVVTRQPLSDPFYSVSLEAGNRNLYQPSFDLSGPLDEEGNVLYRFIASYRSEDSFQEFADSQITTIAPSLSLSFGDRTDLDLFYEYIDYSASPPEDYSVLFDDGSTPSRSFYLGYPDFLFRDITTQKFGYALNHEFSNAWQIRNNFSANVTDARDSQTSPISTIDNRFVELGADNRDFGRDSFSGNIDLIGEFNTGSVSH